MISIISHVNFTYYTKSHACFLDKNFQVSLYEDMVSTLNLGNSQSIKPEIYMSTLLHAGLMVQYMFKFVVIILLRIQARPTYLVIQNTGFATL